MMMPDLGKIQLGWKAARELGIRSTSWFVFYRLGLNTGYYRRALPRGINYPNAGFSELSLPIPSIEKKSLLSLLGTNKKLLINQAKEIVIGKFRPFAGDPVRLNLTPSESLDHWTDFETRKSNYISKDIKIVWEPARFQWAFILARAFALTGDEIFSACFWENFEQFEKSNPPFLGVNWISSQEVAIRLIALTFAICIFRNSKHSTLSRQQHLVTNLVNHALRIQLTLPYARAQRNNHLLSEAVGLYTAGVVLNHYPNSPAWKKKGWSVFNKAINDQIDDNGVFIQQSMNYHRLMLHDSLWFHALAKYTKMNLPAATKWKLGQSLRWLVAQMDFSSGATPNLGHNDGSNFLKLDCCEYSDYRSVAQAGSIAFLDKQILPNGIWNEMCLWLDLPQKKAYSRDVEFIQQDSVNKLQKGKLKVFLRSAKFHARPAHADQLHVDLWWDTMNIAMDAGTYQYNLPAPWTNSLGKTLVHNTVTMDEKDQMTWAGRFLWLDWAQAKNIESQNLKTLMASHNGYRKLGISHKRNVRLLSKWEVEIHDEIIVPNRNRIEHVFWLQWLLPDLPWKLNDSTLVLTGTNPYPKFSIAVNSKENGITKKIDEFQVIRMGCNLLSRQKVNPILGWYSPLYGQKIPCLSFRACLSSMKSVNFISLFNFS